FAGWSIMLTVIAAPIDDLWHRLFGLDVTLWSPPHLLGLAGGVLNAAAGWVIAREAFPRDSRARQVALVLAGALVAAGLSVALQPGIRMAYVYGGVRFFTYAILGALLLPLALVVTARLSGPRPAPLAASIVFGLTMMAGSGVALALQPAFADSLPSVAATGAAGVLTLLAGTAGGALAARVADVLEDAR